MTEEQGSRGHENEEAPKIKRQSITSGELAVFLHVEMLARNPNIQFSTGRIQDWLKTARDKSQEENPKLWEDWKKSRTYIYTPDLAEEMLKNLNYGWISLKSRGLGRISMSWDDIKPAFDNWLTEEPQQD